MALESCCLFYHCTSSREVCETRLNLMSPEPNGGFSRKNNFIVSRLISNVGFAVIV
jgi:hypothetical protein